MPPTTTKFSEGEYLLYKEEPIRLGPLSMEGGKGLVVLLLGIFPVFSLFQYKNHQFPLTLQGRKNCMSVH